MIEIPTLVNFQNKFYDKLTNNGIYQDKQIKRQRTEERGFEGKGLKWNAGKPSPWFVCCFFVPLYKLLNDGVKWHSRIYERIYNI